MYHGNIEIYFLISVEKYPSRQDSLKVVQFKIMQMWLLGGYRLQASVNQGD